MFIFMLDSVLYDDVLNDEADAPDSALMISTMMREEMSGPKLLEHLREELRSGIPLPLTCYKRLP